MINTLVLENDAIKEICNTVIDKIENVNIKYAKSLQKSKKDYDLYIMFLNLENDLLDEKTILKTFDKNVIIFIERYNNKFLWKITNMYNPVDVILTSIPKQIIYERIYNNIKKIESEVI